MSKDNKIKHETRVEELTRSKKVGAQVIYWRHLKQDLDSNKDGSQQWF